MIGIDTKVLVRYLVRDDQSQYDRARRLIQREVDSGEPVLVSLLVMLEMEWILRSRYALAKADDLDLRCNQPLTNLTPTYPTHICHPDRSEAQRRDLQFTSTHNKSPGAAPAAAAAPQQ